MTGPKPPNGQVVALVVVADTHPEHRSGHPPSANPCQSMTISRNLSRWKPKVTDPKPPDGVAVAPVADVGLPPEQTLQVAPSVLHGYGYTRRFCTGMGIPAGFAWVQPWVWVQVQEF
jgi:hypothetical protein